MPELSHYKKSEEAGSLSNVKDEQTRKKILEAVRAVEMHMVLSCTAVGILQILSIHLTSKVNSDQLRYQRPLAKKRISEAAVMYYLRKHIFRLMGKSLKLCITRIIRNKQMKESEIFTDSLVS